MLDERDHLFVLNRKEELEFRRQLVFRVKAVREIDPARKPGIGVRW